MVRHRRQQDRRNPCAARCPQEARHRNCPRAPVGGATGNRPGGGAGMAEQDVLDDDLRALDQVAEERGGAALPVLQAAVERMRGEGDRDRLMWALPPLARAYALLEKFEQG